MAFPTIPTVAAGRILWSSNLSPAGTHTFPNLSSLTKNAGDLLIAGIIQYDVNSTNAEFSAWGGGFTEFADQAGTATMGMGLAYKWSTGSETGTFTVTSADTSTNDSVCFIMSIPGAHPTSPPEAGTMATGTGASNPDNFTPSWGAADILWIAMAGSGETSTAGSYTGVSTAPTNYGDLSVSGITADVVGGVEGGLAFRQLNAASEDVGTFGNDTSNARDAAILIAVRPAPDPITGSFTADAHIKKNDIAGSFTADARIGLNGDNAYEDEVLLDNPTFFVPFDEASGNFTDLIQGATVTAYGTPTYGITGPVTGKTAVTFPSSSDYTDTPDIAALDVGDTNFSIEVWVKHAYVNDTIKVIANKRNNSFALVINESEKFEVGKAGVEGFFKTTNSVANDAWTHLVWTRTSSGSANNKLYINGVSETLVDDDNPAGTLSDNASVVEFAREGASFALLGSMAYFAVYKGTVLSDARVLAHYEAATSGGSTTYNGSFTADANIKNTIAGSFTADSNISKTDIAGTFTADAYIKQTLSGTWTADAFIKNTIAGTLTANANIRRNDIAGTFTADAYIKQTFSSSFTANASIRQTFSGSVTADAYIKQTTAGSFTANSNIKSTIASTFTADAYVKRLDIAGSFTADAYVRKTFSGTFTADAYIRQTFASSFTANAHIKSTVAGTFTADSHIFKVISGSFTADAQIANVVSGSLTANAHIKSTVAGTFTADAYVKKTLAGSVTADAYIRQTFAGSVTADAYIRQTFSGSLTADAYVRSTASATFTADSYIRKTIAGTLTADAYVLNVSTGSWTADAHVSATVAGSLTANAHIVNRYSGSFTADASIGAQQGTTFPGSFTADAHIKATVGGSFSANAYVKRLDNLGSFTADAYVRNTFASVFAADAYVRQTFSGSVSADAYIRRTFESSVTADAFIARVASGNFTADAYIRATVALSFIAYAWIYNPNAVVKVDTNPSKSSLLGSRTTKTLLVTANVTTSSALSGRTTKDA